MSTLASPQLSSLDYDPTEEWHIAHEDRNVSLCGEDLTGATHLPEAEVPDEITCPRCLRLEALREAKL